jgi:hypothetical protein
MRELLDRKILGKALEDDSQPEQYEIHQEPADRLGRQNLVNTFIDRSAGTYYTKDPNRDHKALEIDLFAVSERIEFVGWPLCPPQAIEQQHLIASIDHRMDVFRQHPCAACQRGRYEFSDCNERVAKERGKNDLFG